MADTTFTNGTVVQPDWLNDVNDITYGLGSTASGKGAELIGFKQAGIGAVDRTLSEKLRESVSVKDFGAVGDGVTDDTAAIQAAINNTDRKTIYFPAGTYSLGGMLTLANAGKELVFDSGAVLKRSFNGAPMILITGYRWRILGGEFNGNKSAYADSANAGIFIVGSNNEVAGCLVFDCGSHGISIDGGAGGGYDNKITNNQVNHVDAVGISQFSARRSVISGNIILSAGAEGITVDVDTTRTRVIGNVIVGAGHIGGVGGIGVDLAYYNTISHNTIEGTLNNLPGICLQCQAGNCYHNSIVGNNLYNNSSYGIWLRYRTIIFPTTTGAYGQSDWNTIVGNTFKDNGTAPIRVDANCIGNVLSGNVYDGFLPDIDAAAVATRVDPGLVHFYARNTVIRADVTGDGTSYQIPLNSVVIDRGLGFNPATGIFTAPVSGIYTLSGAVRVVGDGTQDWLVCWILAGGKLLSTGVESLDREVQMSSVSASVFLNKGETASFYVRVGGGTKTVDVESDANHTWFTGTLIG